MSLHRYYIIWHMEFPLTRVQRLTKWSPGYQLVHQVSRAICFAGALSIHVPCMQLPLETLTLMGLSTSKESMTETGPYKEKWFLLKNWKEKFV